MTRIKPLISERTFDLGSKGWYTFAVTGKTDKAQAAKAIEELFQVKVEQIKSAVKKGKIKRNLKTRVKIKKGGYKRVMVKLAKDQKIDLFEASGK